MKSSILKTTQLPVDIIIPTYKRGSRAYEVALSVLKQCSIQDTITIVAQGSDTFKFPENERITILYIPEANLPNARNKGIQKGKNPVVLFLDDDVIVQPNLINAHRKCYEMIETGAVAGFIEEPLFSPKIKIPSSYDAATGKLVQNFSCDRSQFTISMMGANMSFRRDVFLKSGMFDTRYCRNALWEEIDMAFRLQNAGYRIWFCSNAKVKHLRAESGGCRSDISKTYIFYLFSNTTYFLCKFSPLKHFIRIFTYWKYRLEYESRKTSGKPKKISHHLPTVLSGLSGVISGFIKFLLYGKRYRLPDSVTTATEVLP